MADRSEYRDRDESRLGSGAPGQPDPGQQADPSGRLAAPGASGPEAARFPDGRLLVLQALDRCGRGRFLDHEERQALEAARPRLEEALRASAALDDVLTRIADDAAEFERVWHEATAGAAREERPAVRRMRDAARPPLRPVLLRRFAAAAALAGAIVISVLLVGDRRPASEVITGREGMTEVDLADGTSVRLTAGSRLTYRPARGNERFDRKVSLDGSAYFVVAPDAGRVFEVQTSEATATVLGTRFGVVQREGGTDVVLASGEVAVASAAAPDRIVTLQPGTMSRIAAGEPASEPIPVDVVEALDWTGLFVFRGETYARIAEHLTRHYDVPIRVAEQIASERQTGTFDRSLELVEILAIMERSWGFSVRRDPSGGFELVPVAE